MRRAVALAVLALLVAAPAAAAQSDSSVRRGSHTLRLALALERILERGDNLAVSPLSMQQAFAMADAGARGRTRRQLEAALRLRPGGSALHSGMAALERALRSGAGAEHVRLDIANGLWPQRGYPMRRGFVDVMRRFYGAAPEPLDFRADPEAARRHINDWASDRTAGRIENLFAPRSIHRLTRLVLANAIYLKADWHEAFDPADTRRQRFRRARGEPVEVPMMRRTGEYPVARRDGYTAVELPYVGRRLAMLVVIPDGGRFASVARRLDARAVARTVNALREQEIALGLPRFTIRSDLELIAPLRRLGARDAFDDGRADFSGLSPRARADRLHIGKAVQKAFVQVDETGTEAAAVTGVAIEAVSAPAPVVADRPFLFFIRDRPTGAVLFLGRVLDPS
jgi:serpin B